MKKGVILVDFDNVFSGGELSPSRVEYRLSQFVDESLQSTPDVEHLEVRLYGGWKCNAAYTQRADIVRGYLEGLNSHLFPVLRDGRRIFGHVNLVTSQYNLDIEWQDTFQEKRGDHRLKVMRDDRHVCHQDPSRCPIHMVAAATRNETVTCPNADCDGIDISQLYRMEQKMVDSMMTCDILEYVHGEDGDPDDRYTGITVVSDDVDLHPALALAGKHNGIKKQAHLLLLVHNQRKSQRYQSILTPYQVSISIWK